jgi:hypothetical protein
VVVDLPDHLFGVPGQLHLAAWVAGSEHADEPFPAFVRPAFGGDGE